ncbi:MAG TPA: hypothetical protein VL200_06405 [Lacunisphaera sp.]|jgi:hypothetical protein|nr:hypothetical protein [Lacunisphaera sp.]
MPAKTQSRGRVPARRKKSGSSGRGFAAMSPQRRREVAARGGRASGRGRRRSSSAAAGESETSHRAYDRRDFEWPAGQERDFDSRPYRDYGLGYEPGFRGNPAYSDWRQQEYEAGAWRRRQQDHPPGGHDQDPRHENHGPPRRESGDGPRGRFERESEHLPGGYAPPRAREDYGSQHWPRDLGTRQPEPRGPERHHRGRGRLQRSRSRR